MKDKFVYFKKTMILILGLILGYFVIVVIHEIYFDLLWEDAFRHKQSLYLTLFFSAILGLINVLGMRNK